ncbi:MAG: hypothetical protein ACI9XP_000350 [Lentimonas sp.]|jgi:hypothetical protein
MFKKRDAQMGGDICCDNAPKLVCYIEVSPSSAMYEVIGDNNPLPDDNLIILNNNTSVGIRYGQVVGSYSIDESIIYTLR